MSKEKPGIKTIYAVNVKDLKKTPSIYDQNISLALKKGKVWHKIELTNTIPQYGQDKPYPGKEDDLQIAVANFLNLKKAHFTHPPNGGSRHKMTTTKKDGTQSTFSPEAQKLKAMGTKAGASDVLIFEPSGNWHGLHIELKAKKGTVSNDQVAWLEKSRERGYYACICWNLDAVMQVWAKYKKGVI